MAWIMELIVIGITLCLWALFYRRMVPLLSPKRRLFANSSVMMTVTSVDGSTKTLTRCEENGAQQRNGRENARRGSCKGEGGEAVPMPIRLALDAGTAEDREGKLSIAH
jgi:hypothetical protein